ncbi:hydrolase [Vallitalea longa]|uniref:Hydrolase n=1 Tax=Vallitalea longa TaxID=2936439 RepID=A0A9W6DHD4_9FIRM|nr:carbon-nitrogen hydrolase family protein [Vallitalea longa]GKX30754.1 hydrolase [Vallitalea longa]
MKLKIALLQLEPNKNDQLANTVKADSYCRQAAKEGADIVLLPEMWNIGYTPYHNEVNDYDYNPCNPKYPELLEKWKRQSISTDSDYIKHFCYLAKELNIAIGITYLETYGNQNPRNTLSIIDHNGNIVMTYAKVHTCDFSLEYHCTSGDEFKVIDLETSKGRVKIGAMICYDREFPESARVLMLKGAEIVLVPNACELEINRLSQIRTRAFENMVGIAVCNYAGKGLGHSVAFDGIAFDENGCRDMKIIEADENEGIYMADFNLESLRDYRKRETWGNAYRKPNTYKEIVSTDVKAPFIRNNKDWLDI